MPHRMPPSSSNDEKRVRIALSRETKSQVTRLQAFRREAGLEAQAVSLESIVADAVDCLYRDTFGE